VVIAVLENLHDLCGRRSAGLDAPADFEPVDVRQVDVEQHQIGLLPLDEVERLLSGGGLLDRHTGTTHHLRLDEPAGVVVVDHEDAGLFRGHQRVFGTNGASAAMTSAIACRSLSRVSCALDSTTAGAVSAATTVGIGL
jgi:hypothetical protein